ncbi:putative transport permease YfiN [Vallitalea longa]|uniref:Transport permease YfiN n=1 Tax=Vallitalea longa TaxID=2936439 RepID=A0A9W5Y9J2_9FIRM|nr:ABC transporter permease [Vallitalea longa]GKX29785.1 putative transport permease YfiN [Vallitalea longa]
MFAVLKVKILGCKKELPLLLCFIAMMLIFTYIFGASFTSDDNKPKVSVVDNIDSDISRMMISKLKDSNNIEIEETSYEAAESDVENSKSISAIVFNQSKNNDINLSIMYINETTDIMMVKNLLQSAVMTFRNNINLTDITYEYLNSKNIEIDKDLLSKNIMNDLEKLKDKRIFYKIDSSFIDSTYDGYDNLKQSLAGFSLFFSMFLVFFGIGTIIEEKKNYVWQRQLVSPIKNSAILSGNLMATFIVGFLNIFVMVYAGKYLFHVDWGKSDLGILLILGAFIFTVTCLGLFISSFFKTQQQLSAIVPVITVSTSMLGGCMWPLEMIKSKTLLFIANLTPQKWALEGIKDMIMYGHGIDAVVTPVLVLLLMGIVYLILGTRFIRMKN